jgi:hypothetical protein
MTNVDIMKFAELKEFCLFIEEHPEEYEKFKRGLKTFIVDTLKILKEAME